MNTTNIKMISCDLDGTLLNAHGNISPYSKSILIELQKQGYCLVLNSGRFYHEVEPFIEQLELSTYGGYVICSNGYVIHNCKSKAIHTFDSISYEECLRMFTLSKKAHVLVFYYANDTYSICTSRVLLFSQYIFKGLIRLFHPIFPNHLKKYIPLLLNTNIHTYYNIPSFNHVEKLCFIQLPYLLKDIKKNISNNEKGYHFFGVNPCSVEMVKQNVSKANAIAYVCEQNGLTLEQVIAFGDAGNDIPLLQQAGIGVLMKNARNHMKIHTDIYTEYDNINDGVAKFLEKYVLK